MVSTASRADTGSLVSAGSSGIVIRGASSGSPSSTVNSSSLASGIRRDSSRRSRFMPFSWACAHSSSDRWGSCDPSVIPMNTRTSSSSGSSWVCRKATRRTAPAVKRAFTSLSIMRSMRLSSVCSTPPPVTTIVTIS